MRRSFVFLVGLTLLSASWAQPSTVSSANSFTELQGEWRGWWRPRNVYKQGGLSFSLAGNGGALTGAMTMHEFNIGGELTLRDFSRGADGQYLFVAEDKDKRAIAVELRFLDDKSALYGTADVGGMIVYLRLFR